MAKPTSPRSLTPISGENRLRRSSSCLRRIVELLARGHFLEQQVEGDLLRQLLHLGDRHAARVRGADQRSHARAGDAVDRHAVLLEHPDDADVRRAAGTAAGQHEADHRTADRLRRFSTELHPSPPAWTAVQARSSRPAKPRQPRSRLRLCAADVMRQFSLRAFRARLPTSPAAVPRRTGRPRRQCGSPRSPAAAGSSCAPRARPAATAPAWRTAPAPRAGCGTWA